MGALIVLGLATLSGVPAFVTLAGVAPVLFRGAGEPIASIPIAHYSLTNPALPTIPMFNWGSPSILGGAPAVFIRRIVCLVRLYTLLVRRWGQKGRSSRARTRWLPHLGSSGYLPTSALPVPLQAVGP